MVVLRGFHVKSDIDSHAVFIFCQIQAGRQSDTDGVAGGVSFMLDPEKSLHMCCLSELQSSGHGAEITVGQQFHFAKLLTFLDCNKSP